MARLLRLPGRFFYLAPRHVLLGPLLCLTFRCLLLQRFRLGVDIGFDLLHEAFAIGNFSARIAIFRTAQLAFDIGLRVEKGLRIGF